MVKHVSADIVTATSDTFFDARRTLSRFIRYQARLTAFELGVGWHATADAPKTLTELRDEFHECRKTHRPMRVLNHFSDSTIFDCPSTNWAMRFWHDTRHVWLGADFTTESELSVAACHLAVAKHAGHGPGSLVYDLLYADTAGQTLYVAKTRRFVDHQLDFALDVVNFGLSVAIQREV
jgi:hypothetical protein